MSSGFLIYADNEPKSVPARDLGDCRDNLRNSRSVFLIVMWMYVSAGRLHTLLYKIIYDKERILKLNSELIY